MPNSNPSPFTNMGRVQSCVNLFKKPKYKQDQQERVQSCVSLSKKPKYKQDQHERVRNLVRLFKQN